jgi:hypothetical protein
MGNQVCVLVWKASKIALASTELRARRFLQTSCHWMVDGTAIFAPRLCMESRKTAARARLSSFVSRDGVGGSAADRESANCPLAPERSFGVVLDWAAGIAGLVTAAATSYSHTLPTRTHKAQDGRWREHLRLSWRQEKHEYRDCRSGLRETAVGLSDAFIVHGLWCDGPASGFDAVSCIHNDKKPSTLRPGSVTERAGCGR